MSLAIIGDRDYWSYPSGRFVRLYTDGCVVNSGTGLMGPCRKFFWSHCHYPMEAKGSKAMKGCLFWCLLNEALNGIIQPPRVGLHVRNHGALERAA